MKHKTAIAIAVILALLSCNSKHNDKVRLFDEKIQQHYSHQTNKHVDLPSINAIILLPREGCEGCISDASEVAINLLETRDDIAVVFTVVNDLKLLKRQYGDSVLNNDLVSIDFQNLFGDARISSIYPQIAFLKNGKCINIEVFGDESEDYNKLFNQPN